MTTEIIKEDQILNATSVEQVEASLILGQEGRNVVSEAEKKNMTKIRLSCSPGWFVWDGLGITCAGITYGLIGFAEFVVVCVILLPEMPSSVSGYFHLVIFSLLAFLAIVAHVRAMTTDPGTIPRGNFTESNIRSLGLKAGDVVVRCTKCECIKLSRAHHCSTCKRCIRKMDHHCPWINNCVGEYNQKFFMLFTFYIMSVSAYALGLAIRYIFVCATKDWEDCAYFSPPATVVFVVFLVFEGLLFGIFTLVMLCTQVNAVVTDETGIEHLKKEDVAHDGDWRSRLQDVFGGKFSIFWLSPFSGVPAHRRSDYAFREI